MYANGLSAKIRYVDSLLERYDFVGITETRETAERKATVQDHICSDSLYFSSYIDARSGGVALLLKKTFVDQFEEQSWRVLDAGRAAILDLRGSRGALSIFISYFDPSNTARQIFLTKLIATHMRAGAHNLLIGDWNFVCCTCDRYNKRNGHWSADHTVAAEWAARLGNKGVLEWDQENFTFESSSVLSRLDRVYSDIHPSSLLVVDSFCCTLDIPSALSDHKPVAFGIRPRTRGTRRSFPSRILGDPAFKDKLISRVTPCLERASTSSFSKLAELKRIVHRTSHDFSRNHRGRIADNNEDKLSATIGFLRAALTGKVATMERLQSSYPRLRSVLATVRAPAHREFRSLQDHALELSQAVANDRLDELRRQRDHLPKEVYEQRRSNIVSSLSRLVPGSAGTVKAVRDPTTGWIATEPREVARILTEHWQQTFGVQRTDRQLRERWIDKVRGSLHVTIEDLTPTIEDVEGILASLPSSSPGPDGVPFAIFSMLRGILTPLFLDLALLMLRGEATPPEDFNLAYLVCLPKGSALLSASGKEFYDPGNARPLSIVDASNRILASIFRVALERSAASWVPRCRGDSSKGGKCYATYWTSTLRFTKFP